METTLPDYRVQRLDELTDRIDRLPGYEWPFPMDDLWRRVTQNDPDRARTNEMLRELEKDVMRHEAAQLETIQRGMRQVKRFLQAIGEKGEYSICRRDGTPMGMGEQVYVGDMFEAMEKMVAAYGRTE